MLHGRQVAPKTVSWGCAAALGGEALITFGTPPRDKRSPGFVPHPGRLLTAVRLGSEADLIRCVQFGPLGAKTGHLMTIQAINALEPQHRCSNLSVASASGAIELPNQEGRREG